MLCNLLLPDSETKRETHPQSVPDITFKVYSALELTGCQVDSISSWRRLVNLQKSTATEVLTPIEPATFGGSIHKKIRGINVNESFSSQKLSQV